MTVDNVNRHYRVTVYERAHTASRVVAILGTDPPTPTGGGGGHTVMPLPQRGAVATWQGRPDLIALTLPLRFVDQFPEPTFIRDDGGVSLTGKNSYSGLFSIDRPLSVAVNRLIKMWRPADPTIPPPVLKLKAAHNLVPYSHLPYVMTDFQWGAAQASKDGYRTIQDLTLVLLEYRADEQLQAISSKSSSGTANRTVYRVKHGDTLSSIAKRFGLTGWKELGAAQHPPITDPRKLKVGQRLSIPNPGRYVKSGSGLAA